MDHFVPEESWDETSHMISTVLAGETLSAVPSRRYNKNGDIVEVSISGSTYRNRKGELDGSVVILRDVTNSRRLQQQVMDIGEQVRRRIGQDLHDDLCPHLIGIQGLSTVLTENLREASSTHSSLAQKVVDLMDSAIDKARTLSRGLCPVHLVAHGFIAALEDIAQQTEAVFNVTCRFEGDEKVVIADNTVATHLYYIAQEAVQNAVKHADADRISILLDYADERIHLQIVDNGKGIPVEMKSSGIGLQIMQHRARIINAAYQITSGDNGTSVHVSLKTAS
jgi:signal transduction histidine kinase